MSNLTLSEYFTSIDEPYLAGLFKSPEKGYFYRHCRAYAEWYMCAEPVEYKAGEKLYPALDRPKKLHSDPRAVFPVFAHTYYINRDLLKGKGCLPDSKEYRAVEDFAELSHGFGYMHGAANYKRIVKEGLDSYRERILNRPENTEDEKEFKDGLLCLVDAMKAYVNRCRDYLISVNAPTELVNAISHVPFKPARTYYEGLVSWNLIFYFDGCDNLGCLDAGLAHLYNGEDLTEVIAELFKNIDAMGMWSCSIGPKFNEISRQALKACHGRRRPMLEVKINGEAPDDIWRLSYESLKCGNSNPSFYNDTDIQAMLHRRFPQISAEDLTRFCGCGCTETNLEGVTRAGGTDLDVNLLAVFERYIYENLTTKENFEDFFEGMCKSAEAETEKYLNEIESNYRHMSLYLPQPMRTLLYDDCIDKGKHFNAGGARYTWTMNSESGLINVIDSLAAVKKLYYEDKKYTAEEFLSLLKAEDEEFYSELKKCPCYGTDIAEVDTMGAEFAERVFNVYQTKKPTLEFIDGFMLTEHQFSRYERCGEVVGPTPDGRHNGQPLCDSIAALRGKAINGPTAMLCSAAKLPQNLVEGISVINVTLSKNTLSSPEILKGLITGYFAMHGIQVQFTLTSVEELQDAMLHPEKHEDLIVRVGGYSEYFNRLSDALKQTVIERNIHEL